MRSGEMIDGCSVIVEISGFSDPAQRWQARVHLGKGPEALRHAYGADRDAAVKALKAKYAMEAKEGTEL